MPDAGHPAVSALRPCPCRGEARAGTVEPRNALGDLLLADDERRQQADDIIPGAHGEHVFGARRIDQFAGRNQHPQADQADPRRAPRRPGRDSGP